MFFEKLRECLKRTTKQINISGYDLLWEEGGQRKRTEWQEWAQVVLLFIRSQTKLCYHFRLSFNLPVQSVLSTPPVYRHRSVCHSIYPNRYSYGENPIILYVVPLTLTLHGALFRDFIRKSSADPLMTTTFEYSSNDKFSGIAILSQ